MTPNESEFLSEFYHKYYNKLFIHACAVLGRRDLAEVAVQEAFQIACQNIDRLQSSVNPVGWMKKTIEHVSLHIMRDQRRDQKFFVYIEDLAPGTEITDSEKSDWELKDRCLKAISKDEFEFFLRIAEAGFTYSEEAERLNISISACYKRLERIRTKLKKALQEDLQKKLLLAV